MINNENSRRLVAGKRVNITIALLALTILRDYSWQLPPIAEAQKLEINATQPSNGPRLEISPNALHIKVSGSYALFCKPAGAEPQMFGDLRWHGPNSDNNWEQLGKKHKVEWDDGDGLKLFIKAAQTDDAGTYYCTGSYQGEPIKSSVQAILADQLKILDCPPRQYIVKGVSDQKIRCQFEGYMSSARLYKNDVRLDKFVEFTLTGMGVTLNRPPSEADAGPYKIVINNKGTGEQIEMPIQVDVLVKPEIVPHNGSDDNIEFYGVEGEPFEIKCNATGNPPPLVYWLNAKSQNVTHEGGYVASPETGVLKINKASKIYDQGLFQCQAVNSAGRTSRHVSVVVDTRPDIQHFENVTRNEGDEMTVECRSKGSPVPKFSIRRHGLKAMPYLYGDGVFRDDDVKPEGGGSSLTVYTLRLVAHRSNFGLHYCNATNRAGTAERSAHFFVNYKPDLSQTPSEQFVKVGKNVTVTCHVKAYPKPTITWYSDNIQIIDPITSIKSTPDNQVHIVTMSPPANVLSSSKFSCVAQNIMGTEERSIRLVFTFRPGPVRVTLIGSTPTTVNLQLSVPNDGGDRIKTYKYKLDGRTLHVNHPIYNFTDDLKPEVELSATSVLNGNYTFMNLSPYYEYRLTISAVNDMGEGDKSEFHFHTLKPTRPDVPVIVKPNNLDRSQLLARDYPSDYNNGYVLKWNPPGLDNGGTILKYIVRYSKLDKDPLDMNMEIGEERIVEQMSERPMHAKLGPLESNQRYKIQVQARNDYGDSDPASIIIYTSPDSKAMPEFESPQPLAWLTETSTLTVLTLLSIFTILLIVIDVTFCLCCQMGISHSIRGCCRGSKSARVTSELSSKPDEDT